MKIRIFKATTETLDDLEKEVNQFLAQTVDEGGQIKQILQRTLGDSLVTTVVYA